MKKKQQLPLPQKSLAAQVAVLEQAHQLHDKRLRAADVAAVRAARGETMKNYQLVHWFPEWRWFGFLRYDIRQTDMALIYEWLLWFGFWEIRKWTSRERANQLRMEYRP